VRSAEELVAAVRGAGLRVTAARRAVCAVLADSPEDHLSAADIVERVSSRGIDPSTVYRILDTLQGLGLVHHVHLGHGAGAYHLTGSRRHHHLVCEACGAVVDIPLVELRSAIESVTAPHGFVADGAHFAIVGRCASCARRS
jgi:Fe2+ or Zn2+ uptake regulation protein